MDVRMISHNPSIGLYTMDKITTMYDLRDLVHHLPHLPFDDLFDAVLFFEKRGLDGVCLFWSDNMEDPGGEPSVTTTGKDILTHLNNINHPDADHRTI